MAIFLGYQYILLPRGSHNIVSPRSISGVTEKVAILTKDGVYTIVRGRESFQMKRIAQAIPDAVTGWWTQQGELILQRGRAIGITTAESGGRLFQVNDFYLLNVQKNKVIKHVPVSEALYLQEGTKLSPDKLCIVLVGPGGREFSKESLSSDSEGSSNPEYGEVFALNMNDGSKIPVFIEGKQLTCTAIDFWENGFLWTPSGELVYANTHHVYRGRNSGGKINLKCIYTPPTGFVDSVGFVGANDSIVAKLYDGRGGMVVIAISSEGRIRTLLKGENVLTTEWRGSNILPNLGDSPWVCVYADATCKSHPPGYWLVNAETGETRYLNSAEVTPSLISNDGTWWSFGHTVRLFHPPMWDVKRWTGKAFTSSFSAPGWLEILGVVGPPGSEFFVGREWSHESMLWNSEVSGASDTLFVYDPHHRFIQYLSSNVKGVILP